jgi:hypothetical protein
MLKRRYGWVVLIGLAFALLAAAALVQSGAARSQDNAALRLRVQLATARLEQCLSCHPQNTTVTLVYRATGFHASDPAQELPSDISDLPAVDGLKTQVDHQLFDLGKRIVAVPESDHQSYAAVAQEYLRVYETTRTSADRETLLGVLQSLQLLELQLREIENQVAAYRWEVPNETPARISSAALLMPPTTPPQTAFEGRSGLLLWMREAVPYPADDRVWVLSEVVFVAHRCGPPADAAVEFVWSGRLPSIGAQSPFVS